MRITETLPRIAHPLSGIRLLGTFAAAAIFAILIAVQAWRNLTFLITVPILLIWPVELGLGLFALVVPFGIVALGEGDESTKIGWVVGAGAGAALLFSGVVLGRFQKPPAAARYWILLVVWAGLTTFWALNRGEALQMLPTAVSLVVLYVVAASVRVDEKQFFRVCIMALLGGCAAAAIGAHHAFQQIASTRLFGITGTQEDDPNIFAASLLLPLAIAASISLTQRSWFHRGLAMVAVGVITLGILFTMSRGALLSIATMIGVFAYRLRFSRRVILIMSVIAMLLAFMPGLLFQRIKEAETGNGRLAIWNVGLTVLRHYALLGVGLNNFHVAFNRFASDANGIAEAERFSRDSHNTYLAMTADLGLAGIALFGAAIISQLKHLKRFYGRSGLLYTCELAAIEAATWGLLVAGFFLNLCWKKFFWLDWMLLAQAVCVAERKLLHNRTI
jgi:O-Antigen ligase